MREDQSGETAERTLWVITSIRHLGRANPPVETSFIYAQDEEEANAILIRWKELHLGEKVQSFEPHPEGVEKDGKTIEGKKMWGGS